jgi:hypothetical protein
MRNKSKLLRISEKKSLLFIFICLFISYYSFAQNDTIYFDANWKNCSKELAIYYRIQPEKIETKKAIGYKIKNIDSVYSIKDYYLKNHKLQFQGYSKDKEAQELVGDSKWFDENETLLNTQNYNYKETHSLKLLEWQPIFYINYSITVKNQFAGGLEFCLDCENKNKLFLGLGYGISSYDDKYFGLPDVHLSLNTGSLLFIKAGGSNRNLYSLAGVSLLNVIDLGFGYSYPLTQDKTPELKGFTFGLTFRITNNKNAYIPLRIGF